MLLVGSNFEDKYNFISLKASINMERKSPYDNELLFRAANFGVMK